MFMIRGLVSIFLLTGTLVPMFVLAQFGGAEKQSDFNEYINRNPNVGVNRSAGFAFRTNLDKNSVFRIINEVADYLLLFLVAVSVFFILWAAWLYLSSGGEEGKTGAAKGYLVYAAIAIAVGLLAKAIPAIVASIIP